MKDPLSRRAAVYAALAGLFCMSPGSAQPPGRIEPAPILETDAYRIRVVTVADGLESPWSMVFLPDGDMLVTERPGRLRLIHDGVLQPEPIAGVPEVRYRNHAGLMDVALHPDFSENRLIYLTYSKSGERGGTTAVLRVRFEGSRLTETRDVFVADAWSERDLNFGSRVLFDDAGMMYVTTGDRGPDGEPLSQELGNHNGTVVRLHDDGRVPDDNPFVGRAGAKPEIYSYGHRNPQGLTLHPVTGEVWASEHGPLGGDEVNILRPGANYGWPVISYGRTYDGEIISEQPWRENMEPPRFYWVPSIGISGLLFYTGDRFPEWKNQLFVTGMSGMMIQRVRLEGRGSQERESMLIPLRQEIRDIRQGPDGLLYVVTRQDANRTEKSGKVLRIEPVE